ncbi:MAG TPA: hypothetical protein VKV26_00165 [Dehalococcoidia bacterium]|nr:hypothetical protein [Dehalococcoidia bacterium]
MDAGLRPRDWDSLSVSRLESTADGCPASAEANLLLYYRFSDAGQPALAAAHLNRLLDVGHRLAPSLQAELALTAAYFAARHVGDAGAARDWLERAPADGAHPALRAQAEAAVLLAEGRCSAAQDAAESGLLSLRDGLLGGLSAVQGDALRELVNAAVAAKPAPPPAPLAPTSSTPPAPSHQPTAAEPPNRGGGGATVPADAGATGPTIGLGVTIAIVAAVTLVVAVMPLPRCGSARLTGRQVDPAFTQSDGSGQIVIVGPDGQTVQIDR